MCIAYLDNQGPRRLKVAENARKTESIPLILLLLMAAIAGLSCRSQSAGTEKNLEPDRNMASSKMAEAEQLYAQREDLSKARQGVALLREARTADYGSYEAAWKLARISYYLGSHTDNEREREQVFREGVEAGKTAVQLGGDKPEGHFWLGANYGGSAEQSTLAGLSSVEDIRREMEAVVKIDEQFQGGSAYLALGQLYLEAPKLLGGDYQKAADYLEKGLKVGSDNALIKVRLAEAYHELNRDDEARKLIDVVLKMTPNPQYLPEYKDAADKAKKLLEKMDRSASR